LLKQMEPASESGVVLKTNVILEQESRRTVLALVMASSKTYTLYNFMYILQREF